MRADVVARGVRPDQAWAWWTDFRAGPEDHAFARWAHPDRRVEELGDGALRITETGKVGPWRLREMATVRLDKPRIRFEARNDAGQFRGTIRFLPDAEGTRIEVVWDERLAPWLRWLGPLGRFAVRRAYAWDLKQHARELERDTRGPDSS